MGPEEGHGDGTPRPPRCNTRRPSWDGRIPDKLTPVDGRLRSLSEVESGDGDRGSTQECPREAGGERDPSRPTEATSEEGVD